MFTDTVEITQKGIKILSGEKPERAQWSKGSFLARNGNKAEGPGRLSPLKNVQNNLEKPAEARCCVQ